MSKNSVDKSEKLKGSLIIQFSNLKLVHEKRPLHYIDYKFDLLSVKIWSYITQL